MPVRDPYLRHDFTLSKRVVRARFFATAQGLYYAYLNGQRIGDDELDSTWTDWSARTLYRGFDVTHLLRSGANTLGVLLGQGQHSATGQAPEFLGQLEITYADGTSAVIGTDGSWTTSPSPITNEDTYFGESYDARLEQPGWDSPGFDASAWQPVHVVGAASANDSPPLEADPTPPIRTVATVSPVKETNPAPGVRVYDFGQNHSGWVRITASARAGTTVDIKKGEILDSNGRVSTANISFAPTDPSRQTDHYTFRGSGSETYEPHFVYAGFRYAEITGLPDSANVTVVARVIHTDVQSAGTFTSSDPLLNEIEQATRQTQLNNLYGVPTDCPTREKKGWMRDGADAAAAAMDNFSMESFYANWLTDMKTSQSANGSEPSVAPSTMFPNVYLDDPAWASAYPELLWSDYVRYGNKSVLAAALRRDQAAGRLLRDDRRQRSRDRATRKCPTAVTGRLRSRRRRRFMTPASTTRTPRSSCGSRACWAIPPMPRATRRWPARSPRGSTRASSTRPATATETVRSYPTRCRCCSGSCRPETSRQFATR